ncbi:MAG: rod shape-determining protein MreC [Neisseriaceae bacterium]|nr:rod shape-determining protein MreC [Neisseriaceae bacterium]MBP6861702.1 rod shape-determining protein MreC [Neisseriaceae bacterium]
MSRALKPTTKMVVLVTASLGLLFGSNQYPLTQTVRNAVLSVLYPIQWLANVPLNSYRSAEIFLTKQNQLHQEVVTLKADNIALHIQMTQLKTLQRELAELKSLQQLVDTPLSVVTSAQVVSNGRDPIASKLLLDKGSAHQIKTGQVVVDKNGLIGQVTNIQAFSAEVSMVTDNKQVVPIMVERTGERALLYGNGQNLDLRYFPIDGDLQVGDLLVTSGLDDTYPAGIPVAKVNSAEKNLATPYYRTKVSPLAGIHRARYVLILPRNQEAPSVAAPVATTPTPPVQE